MLLPQNGFLVVLWNRESSEKCSVHKWKQSGLCNWWGRCSIITSCKKLLLWFSVCFVSYWVKTSNLKYFEEFVRFASVSKSMCVCVCGHQGPFNKILQKKLVLLGWMLTGELLSEVRHLQTFCSSKAGFNPNFNPKLSFGARWCWECF